MTSDARRPSSSISLIRRIVRDYLRMHLRDVWLAVLCMIIVAGTTATMAWLMQPVLDQIFLQKDRTMLTIVPIALVAVCIIGGVANYFQTVLMRKVGQRIVADLQIALFDHMMHADLSLFHDQASGRIISRFTNDIQSMRVAVSTALTGTAKELLTMVFLAGVMIFQSWELSIIAVALFPLAIHPIMRLSKRMRKIADGTQQELGEFTAQLDETFQGVRVVKAYRREDYEVSRARQTVENLFALYLKASRVQAAASPIMEVLGGTAIAAVIAYGGAQVVNGQTTPGAFFSFMAAMLMVYRPLRAFAGLNTNMQEGLAAADRLFKVLDHPPEIHDAEGATPLQVTDGTVQFHHVSFSYAGEHSALHEVELEIPAGRMAALVGPSGSGKSTLMNLLLRFYDAQDGRILIDGQDIRSVTLASLRRSIALVSQDIMLFDDSAAANIAYGREGASREDIIQAAKSADAHDFIMALSAGYDTRIGPSGVRLSGGQRQRIAIARAMLKNAPILLLDEATSALDTQSERSVQNALTELMQHRTTLVIAHRLSTIRHADIIYVLDQGRVAEKGSHDELLTKGGLYARLYHAQFAQAQQAFAVDEFSVPT
ncbi:MAG: ABC transporter ATP-binding protein/permease [Rickettsiales bacterium]|nr:ABC transporter ATP-binding protein/permease [Rickettsiales bacterium]